MKFDSPLYINILQVVADYKDPITTAGICKLATGTSKATIEVYVQRLTGEGFLKTLDTKIFDDGKYQFGRVITDKGRKQLEAGAKVYDAQERAAAARRAKQTKRVKPMTTTELGDKLKAALPKATLPPLPQGSTNAMETGDILFCVLKGRHDDGSLNFVEFPVVANSQAHQWLAEAAAMMKCQFIILPYEED